MPRSSRSWQGNLRFPALVIPNLVRDTYIHEFFRDPGMVVSKNLGMSPSPPKNGGHHNKWFLPDCLENPGNFPRRIWELGSAIGTQWTQFFGQKDESHVPLSTRLRRFLWLEGVGFLGADFSVGWLVLLRSRNWGSNCLKNPSLNVSIRSLFFKTSWWNSATWTSCPKCIQDHYGWTRARVFLYNHAWVVLHLMSYCGTYIIGLISNQFIIGTILCTICLLPS